MGLGQNRNRQPTNGLMFLWFPLKTTQKWVPSLTPCTQGALSPSVSTLENTRNAIPQSVVLGCSGIGANASKGRREPATSKTWRHTGTTQLSIDPEAIRDVGGYHNCKRKQQDLAETSSMKHGPRHMGTRFGFPVYLLQQGHPRKALTRKEKKVMQERTMCNKLVL